jgi:hypothetical protein
MIKGFEFKDGDKSYVCTIEELRGPVEESWWWFSVNGDPQRYAPFHAASSDTRTSVQEHVVAFYTNRLFQLAQPRERGGHFGSRKRPTAPVAAPAADAPKA